MQNLSKLIAGAATQDLSQILDDNQALRLALLSVLGLTQDGGELPEEFREFLLARFQPLFLHWKEDRAPFTEGFLVARGQDANGNVRIFFSEDFIRSLVPD
ncbi:MAG: hypothetical protein AB2L07_16085 [Thermoanaerobaculaceae bacterium]